MPVTTLTDPAKKQKVLPLQDPNTPDLPTNVVQPVAPPASPASKLAGSTLQQAGKQAQPLVSPVAGQVSSQTQQLLKDPQFGYDPQKGVQQGVAQYDRSAADAMEAARQGMVGASGSSLAQAGLQDLALRSMEQRSDVKSNLEQMANDRTSQNVINALNQGRATVGMEQDVQQGDLQNMLAVINAAQPQLQREESALDRGLQIAQSNQNAQLQAYLTELKGSIDSGLQTDSQTWKGIESELDRIADAEMAKGNWQNALDVITEKGKIDEAYQQNNQRWQSAERVATQSWSSDERIDQNTHDDGQAFLDRQLTQAISDGDNATTKWVQTKKAELALSMQLQDMTHDEKMLSIQDMYATAKADGDVGRQQQLMTFQSKIDLKNMEAEHGYDTAIETLRGNIEQDIRDGDNVAAMARIEAELDYRVSKDIEDRKLDWAQQALEEKGLDMTILDQQMSQIDDMIENYGIDPSMKVEFLKATLEGQGVDTSRFTETDVTAEAQKALAAEMELQRSQFVLSHPELSKEIVDPITGEWLPTNEISNNGITSFNEYFNEVMYGELSPEKQEAKRTAGWITDPVDIPLAQVGDKVKLSTMYTLGTGQIPPGEYSVVEDESSSGSKFFGTKKTTTTKYLVNAEGKRYTLGSTTGGAVGNIVSNLWAGDL